MDFSYNWSYIFITLISSLIGFCASQFRYSCQKKSMREAAIALGLQALLRIGILELYDKCRQNGCSTIQDKENMKGLYGPYKELGGNGVVTQIVKDTLEMPTTTKD